MPKNMFAANNDTKPSLSNIFPNSPVNNQSVAAKARNEYSSNTRQTQKSDNSQSCAQNESAAQQTDSFSQTLDEKLASQTSRDAQPNQAEKNKGEKRDQTSATSLTPDKPLTVQEMLAQHEIALGTNVDNQLLQKIAVQASNKSAQSVTNTQTLQSHRPVAEQTGQAATEPVNKTAQQTIDPTLIKSEVISTDSPKSNIPNVQSGKSDNNENMQESGEKSVSESLNTLDTNKPSTTSNTTVGQETTPNVTTEMQTSHSETIAPNEKSTMKDTPTAAASSTIASDKPAVTKELTANLSDGKDLTLETPISDKTTVNIEQSVGANASDDQSTLSKQQVLIDREIAAQVTDKSTLEKADSASNNSPDKTKLFDLQENENLQTENFSAKTIEQKSSLSKSPLNDPKAESHENTGSNQTAADKNVGEQFTLGNDGPSAITEQSPDSTSFTKTTGNANSNSSVSDQIQESIQTSYHQGSQKIVINLNPPELGKVSIKFHQDGNDVSGVLEVSKTQTKYEIQQSLPEIIQNLQGSGIQIKKIEVVLTNQQEQYTPKDQSSTTDQQGGFSQQGTTDSGSQRNNTSYNKWLDDTVNSPSFAEPSMQIADNSINMLV